MGSREDTRGPELSVEAGTQLLLSVSSMGSPFAHLPADATRNIIVVSSNPSAAVEDRLADRRVDVEAAVHVPISGAESEYDGPMWTCDPLVPDDLTGLSMRLSRAFEALGDGGYLLVENLNVFLMYASAERVTRFIDHLTKQAEEQAITGIYTLVGDAVTQEAYEQLRLSVDTELDYR